MPSPAPPEGSRDDPRPLPTGLGLLADVEGPAPWGCPDPRQAVEAVLPSRNGWVRLAHRQTGTLPSLMGKTAPVDRLQTLSFYAFARPGMSVAVVLDPYLPRQHTNSLTGGLYWRTEHWALWQPPQRETMLRTAFATALVAPTPSALLVSVADRARTHEDHTTRAMWQGHAPILLRALLRRPLLTDAEKQTLRTMDSLGAFE